MGQDAPVADGLRERIASVRGKIADAAARSGRREDAVRLCAVTKNVPAPRVWDAWRAGLALFGENRVQEAQDKIRQSPPGAQWHLVGHLQTNKARDAARLFACVQSVDSLRVAEALHRRRAPDLPRLPILIEVNCSGEPSKFGVGPDALFHLLDQVAPLDRLDLRGLMTVGPLSPDLEDARRSFALLRCLRDRAETSQACKLAELSMGMSGDYPAAVEEGATLVRIGTAIFGERRGA